AKREGYRARSAYKLLQIQKKYRILKPGDTVVDLGAAPGGWSQVAKEITGIKGKIIGVDILPIKPIPGIIFLQGDMTKDEDIQRILSLTDKNTVDAIISDMSPNISGNYSVDQARSVFLCEQALKTCDILLKDGGSFVCKIFEGEDLPDFIQKVKNRFKIVKQFDPEASRKSSSEIYIIAKYFKK
ncbi:MAG: 23S rRNA (uridine(2552)-2'-O)-methyltransferase, partial [Candidatus Hydrothermota bacterium]